MNTRRHSFRMLTIAGLTAAAIACSAGLALAATKLWECNRCHQQYQGNSPPAFVKCPATDNKQTHWWIEKR